MVPCLERYKLRHFNTTHFWKKKKPYQLGNFLTYVSNLPRSYDRHIVEKRSLYSLCLLYMCSTCKTAGYSFCTCFIRCLRVLQSRTDALYAVRPYYSRSDLIRFILWKNLCFSEIGEGSSKSSLREPVLYAVYIALSFLQRRWIASYGKEVPVKTTMIRRGCYKMWPLALIAKGKRGSDAKKKYSHKNGRQTVYCGGKTSSPAKPYGKESFL